MNTPYDKARVLGLHHAALRCPRTSCPHIGLSLAYYYSSKLILKLIVLYLYPFQCKLKCKLMNSITNGIYRRIKGTDA